jgi:hypothetical protein
MRPFSVRVDTNLFDPIIASFPATVIESTEAVMLAIVADVDR